MRDHTVESINDDVDRKTLLLSNEVKQGLSPSKRFGNEQEYTSQANQRLQFGSQSTQQTNKTPLRISPNKYGGSVTGSGQNIGIISNQGLGLNQQGNQGQQYAKHPNELLPNEYSMSYGNSNLKTNDLTYNPNQG